jgi:hypothetical protein
MLKQKVEARAVAHVGMFSARHNQATNHQKTHEQDSLFSVPVRSKNPPITCCTAPRKVFAIRWEILNRETRVTNQQLPASSAASRFTNTNSKY